MKVFANGRLRAGKFGRAQLCRDRGEDLRETLREAFLDLRDSAALRVFRAVSLIPAVDADVDQMRN
ncbi:hypothetical protein [Thiobaca trueperi]|uniref:Uncharacterized protein n=1 Tax=Thiobaca trueperi TaxID=127458 RepID=A0A4R3N448_9GAMM|nr:hypothetical protein [Thiobaca trueperi]TCT22806.1 hypothetical protein EDC35_102137 [Thiobaca trueperi]